MDGISVMVNTTVDMCEVGTRRSDGEMDSDHESVVSDYSEMADPVKEHLASIHLLQEAELRFGSVLGIRPCLTLQQRPGEDEIDFLKRQRKVNFLSLAQEFAAVKKLNPDALPFDVHKQRTDACIKGDRSENSNEISLVEELAAVSCVDKADDEVSQIGAKCSDQVRDSSIYHNATNVEHSNQSLSIVLNSCSSSIFYSAEEDCNSEKFAVMSHVPDVVQGLHDTAECGTVSINSVEIDPVNSYHSSDTLTRYDDDSKTLDTSTNTVVSHSKNMDLVSTDFDLIIYLSVFVIDRELLYMWVTLLRRTLSSSPSKRYS